MKFQTHIIYIRKLNEASLNDSDVNTKAFDNYRRTHETNIVFFFLHPSINI